MRIRYLVLAMVAGGLVLFLWQTISNAAIPWHTMTMREFPADSAAAVAVRAMAPANGVYASRFGVIAAVRLAPGITDQSGGAAMLPLLGKQLVLDVLVAGVLALVALRMPSDAAIRTAATIALGTLAVALCIEISNVIWYGFTMPFGSVDVLDQTIAFFLAGLVIGRLRAGADGVAPITAERRGVEMGSGLPHPAPGLRV